MDEEEPGRPAATVVIVRDRKHAPAELLMVERAKTMAFAPGALVFPGGGVDAADVALAQKMGLADVEDGAARIAAVRETIEEAGLALGVPGADAVSALRLRDGLMQGRSLGEMLDILGLMLDLEALTPFARWHPAPFDKARRVYDARFYVARAPFNQMASVDTTENVSLFWASASDVLARADAGKGRIIYPTRRNLERLAQFEDHTTIVAHARTIPVEKIRPWMEERDGCRYLCIPTHLGYPVTAEPMERAVRG